jgi:hypothetical protein
MAAESRIAQIPQDVHLARWSLTCRVAFRFCFVYLGLFCVANALGGLLPILRVDDEVGLGTLWPMRQVTFWTAAHIFGAKLPLIYRGSGSDDKTFDWVLAFCLLVFAVLATAIWSVLNSKRENYITLHKWFRLFIRFTLASELLYFGMAKVIPNQMPVPSIAALLVPLGSFSTCGILWRSIGASPAYEIFAGCAEVLGGVLLILPRTTMIGALVCVADMTEVFMLNMTYDVPVKLFSFHLFLLAFFLLAPECQRLADFAFRNRAAEPSAQAQLFNTHHANRIALAVQIMIGVWLLGMNAYSDWTYWHTDGSGHRKSPLYGIWNVDELSIDGQLRSPLLTDPDRWHRAVFDVPDRMAFQRMDESFAGYGTSINLKDNTIALTNDRDKNWKADFTFLRAVGDQLLLDGNMDSHRIHMRLHLIDRNKFPMVNRSFHWVQEH